MLSRDSRSGVPCPADASSPRLVASDGPALRGMQDSSQKPILGFLQAGGYAEVVCGDAKAMPWPSDHCDLAVAFMVLQDAPDPTALIREIARVLEPGGVLCLAIVHPLNRPVEFLGDYFTERRVSEVVSRRGLEMRFEGVDRPLECYTRALSAAGFVIEELRVPRASSAAVARAAELAPAATKPFFLHMRCRLDEPQVTAGASR